MRWILVLVLVMLGAGAWFVGNVLSSDAIALALGVIFGTLSFLPGAVLVLHATRREAERNRHSPPTPAQLPPPTVIIVQLPDGTRARALLVDGERE